MFMWVGAVFLGLVGVLVSLGFEGRHLDGRLLLATGALGLPVLGALLRMLLAEPGAVRDWIQGGVLQVHDRPERLAWEDWALAFTRRGTVDKRSGALRLERSLLCGLIPLGTVRGSLADYYRVEMRSEAVEDHRRRRHGFLGTGEVRVAHWNHELSLVDRRAARLLVMDLSVTPHGRRKERVITELRAALESLLREMPSGARPEQAAPDQERPASPPSDFERWRQSRQREGS